MNKPKVSILTVTFDQDIHWLNQSYRSYQTFCKDYHSYNVVIDDHQQDCVQTENWLKDNNINYNVDTEAKHIPVGYVRQQYMKFHADQYVPSDTDWVCHVDSDSIFYESHTPDMYFHGDKPVMLYTPYDKISDCDHWQQITTQALKLNKPIEHEFMRRMPLLYPAWLTREIREWFPKHHDQTVFKYLSEQDNFTEYNFFGAYCWEYHRELYHWVDTTSDEYAEYSQLPFLQEHSHGDFSQKMYLINNLLGVPEIHKLLIDFNDSAKKHNVCLHQIPESRLLDYRNPYLVELYRDLLIRAHPHVEAEWPFDLQSMLDQLQV